MLYEFCAENVTLFVQLVPARLHKMFFTAKMKTMEKEDVCGLHVM